MPEIQDNSDIFWFELLHIPSSNSWLRVKGEGEIPPTSSKSQTILTFLGKHVFLYSLSSCLAWAFLAGIRKFEKHWRRENPQGNSADRWLNRFPNEVLKYDGIIGVHKGFYEKMTIALNATFARCYLFSVSGFQTHNLSGWHLVLKSRRRKTLYMWTRAGVSVAQQNLNCLTIAKRSQQNANKQKYF